MRQLIVEDLAASKDVLITVLFTEPGVDLRTPTTGGYVAKVRVQPVAAWVWLFLGDNFNLIAHLQLVGKRYNAPTNFRANASMPHIAMNVVSKIERRGARR